jgi:hypothetical protein
VVDRTIDGSDQYDRGTVAWLGVPVTAVTLAVLTHVTHLYSVLKHSNLGQIDRSKVCRLRRLV